MAFQEFHHGGTYDLRLIRMLFGSQLKDATLHLPRNPRSYDFISGRLHWSPL